MSVRYADDEIAAMMAEQKVLPMDYRARLAPRPSKAGQLERDLSLEGSDGTDFKIIVRQALVNPLRFSVILACPAPGLTNLFLLRRYNGDHGKHTNRIEGSVVRGPHVHQATQRYQELGWREETFAVPDDRFVDLHGAIDALLADGGFVTMNDGQLTMFGAH